MHNDWRSMVKRGQRKAKMRYLWAAVISGLSIIGGYTYFSGQGAYVLSGWLAEALDQKLRGQLQFTELRISTSQGLCLENLTMVRSLPEAQVKLVAPVGCVQNIWSTIGSGLRNIHVHLEESTVFVEPPTPRKTNNVRTASIAGGPGRSFTTLRLSFQGLTIKWQQLKQLSPWMATQGQSPPLHGSVHITRNSSFIVWRFLLQPTEELPELGGTWEHGLDSWALFLDVNGDLAKVLPYFRWPQPASVASLANKQKNIQATPPPPTLRISQLPMDGRIVAESDSDPSILHVHIHAQHNGLNLFHPLITRTPLEHLQVQTQLEATIDLQQQTIDIDHTRFKVNDVPLEVQLNLSGVARPDAHLRSHVRIPSTAVQTILGAIPPEESSQLAQDVDPDITFSTDFFAEGELRSPSTWEPKVTYAFDSAGTKSGLEVFDTSFLFFPLTRKGRSPIGVVLGPGTANWLSYKKIPYIARRAIVISEDATFPSHKGIELAEIRDALMSQLQGGRLRGGSTITQQLVKNLFLSRDRTLLRKAQEVLIAFYLEHLFSKERIFELYVNIVEWGPRIYGLQAASQHYFAVDLQQLNTTELAFLAILIPAPSKYHKYHKYGRIPQYLRRKVNRLLERLHRFGHLSDEELSTALATPIQLAPHID